MTRDAWQRLAWLLLLSAAFWLAVTFRSCDGRPPGPADLMPAQRR
jgi:hypothetical protein